MSQIVRFTGASPYGVQSDMAQITISGGQDTLSLATIEETKKHILHFWVKGGKNTTLGIYKNNDILISFDITTAWSENSVTFDANANDVISMQFGASGSYWVWHPKLEVGTKATDFSESQVDLKTAIVQTSNSISLLAEKTIGDGEGSLKSLLSVQAEQISAKVGSSGGDAKSFAWQLTVEGFYLYSNNVLVFKCDSIGTSITKLSVGSGYIGNDNGYATIGGNAGLAKFQVGNRQNLDITLDPGDGGRVSFVNTSGLQLASSMYGTQSPDSGTFGVDIANGCVYFQLVN